MIFDYSRLRGRIIQIYHADYRFAEKMGITKQALSAKLLSKTVWNQLDIIKACKLLEIGLDEIPIYFFDICLDMSEG